MKNVLASLLLAALVLSGCAASDGTDSSSPSHPATIPRPTTTRFTPPTHTTPPVPDTTTQAPTSTTTTTGGGGGTTTTTTTTSASGLTGGDSQFFVLEINETALSGVTDSYAQVSWNVNATHTVSSHVDYGIGAGNFSLATVGQSGAGPHVQGLLSLHSCSTYAFRISAEDSYLNTAFSYPAPATFTTTGATPTAGGMLFPNIMHTSLAVTWAVTGPPDTKTQLEYGTTTGYGQATPLQVGAGTKSATLTGLVANTLYHFRVHILSACNPGGMPVDTPDVTQYTAELVHIDVKGNLGAAGSFNPGSSPVYSQLNVLSSKRYVFEVKNDDQTPTPQVHRWMPGNLPDSGDVPVGATNTYQVSLQFAPGTVYHMRCPYHSQMDGIINST
ncbi:MAG: fibronectin type III domain-containing protein [Thermoplasmatota archaeon]